MQFHKISGIFPHWTIHLSSKVHCNTYNNTNIFIQECFFTWYVHFRNLEISTAAKLSTQIKS